MIRANLLPRTNERVVVFGLRLEVDLVRSALTGVLLVAIVTIAALAVETLRLARIETDAIGVEAVLAADSERRDEAQRVAFDVARLQATSRRANELHASGNAVARAVAGLGNAIPTGVYLDDLTTDREGVRLRGRSDSLDRIGATVTALASSFPQLRTSIGDVEQRGAGATRSLAFTTILASPGSSASPVPTLARSVSPEAVPR